MTVEAAVWQFVAADLLYPFFLQRACEDLEHDWWRDWWRGGRFGIADMKTSRKERAGP